MNNLIPPGCRPFQPDTVQGIPLPPNQGIGQGVPPHLQHCTTEFIPGKSFTERPVYPAQEEPLKRKPTPLTYLASPYSHPNSDVRKARFMEVTRAAAWLIQEKKWNVFAPITHSHPLAEYGGMEFDWDFWKKIDTEYLGCCERLVVYCLAGWRGSKGVQEEIKIAKQLGIPVLYLVKIGIYLYAVEFEPPDDCRDWTIPILATAERAAILVDCSLKVPTSKATTANPKDLIGATKVSLSKVPAVAVAHCAHAMMDGARKYDAYNFRAKAVQASIYIDACKRHIDAWFEGEEDAPDSKVHHLGHAMACCAIILDCQENKCLIDDRPVTPKSKGCVSRVLARLQEKIKSMPPLEKK